MPVETKLDISLFSSQSQVQELLKSHGFEVTPLRTNFLHLKGSFLSLKLLRKKLARLLAEDKQAQSRSPPGLSNGYSSAFASRTEPDTREHRSVQHSPNQAHFQKSRVNGVSSSVSPSSLSLQQPTSPAHADSASGGSPRSLPNSVDDSSHSRPSSFNQRASMVVEKDVFDYALTYKQEFIKDLETCYRTEMSLIDDGEITMVMFSGRNRKNAQAKLEDLIQDISRGLRTQEIHLSEYSPDKQAEIQKALQLYKDRDYQVLIKLHGDVVKLVGSSSRSFQVKQMLLGHSDDSSTSGRRGRELERNSGLRRSSSLPRHYKVSKELTDQRLAPEPQYHASVAKDYSPAHYQEESRPGRAHPHTPNAPATRTRSRSEVRNKNRDAREQLRQHDDVTLASSDAQTQSTKKQVPRLKAPLFTGKIFKQMPWQKK